MELPHLINNVRVEVNRLIMYGSYELIESIKMTAIMFTSAMLRLNSDHILIVVAWFSVFYFPNERETRERKSTRERGIYLHQLYGRIMRRTRYA